MCSTFKCFVFLAVCGSYLLSVRTEEEPSLLVQDCASQGDCPEHSICTKVGQKLSCICWQGYHQNPEWSIWFNDRIAPVPDYCSTEPTTKTIKIHSQQPAKSENLAVAILWVLFGVTVVVVLIYCFVVLRPIDRTRAAYRRMQLKRSNHRRLEEFYDVDMTFRDMHKGEEHS